MKRFLLAGLFAVCGLAQSATLDTRLSYDSVSEAYTQRVLVYNGWANGVAGFIDIPFSLTRSNFSDDIDTLKNVGTIELSGWWTTPLTKEFYLRPNLNILVGPAGPTWRPTISLGYKPSPQFDSWLRYRYSKRNYSTANNAGVQDKDNAHLVTLWAGWKYSATLEFEYQGDFIKRINNYWNDNRKSQIIETEFQVNFPNAFGKGVTPYVLIDHLGTSFKTFDGKERDRWRPRAGVKLAF